MDDRRGLAVWLALGWTSLLLGLHGVTAPVSVVAAQTPSDSGETPSVPLDDKEVDEQDRTTYTDGRYTVTTRRGGTPDTGVAVARGLHLPESTGGTVADFRLTTDVHFDGGGGPAAVTIRFRYTPEAGGGSGYLLSIDPFAGQVRLVRFEEGRQYALVPWTGHPAAATAAAPLHVDLTACGSEVAVALNGDEVLRTTDGWFDRGTIALGAVTWSEPVSVTFENVSLTVAPE